MKLEQSFEVSAPLDRVWAALIDVEQVAPCLPGAAVTGRNDDGSYNGTFTVKIGPTAAAYSGKLVMETIDEANHTATMDAQGTDRRGQGGAKATIISSVTAIDADTTEVHVDTDYHITGRLARFGRGGMIEEISNRLLKEFAKSLQAMVAAGEVAAGAAPASEPEAPTGYETYVGKAVSPPKPGPGAAAADKVRAAAESVETKSDEPAAEPEPAPEPEPAAEAAPEPPAEPEPAAEAEPEAEPEAEAEAAAEAELAAIVPEASAESAPEVPQAPEAPPAPEAPQAPEAPPAPAAPPPPPEPTVEAEPINGLSLIGSVLVSRVKANPAPFAALLIGFLVTLRIRRRRG